MNNFHYAQYLCDELYGVVVPKERFEELGLLAYEKIGNKVVRTYRITLPVNPEDLSIELPCNADVLEGVFHPFDDWNYTTNQDDIQGDLNSQFVENRTQNLKVLPATLYQRGKLAHFEQVGNKLYFDRPYPAITILYKGQQLDEEGLPELTDAEAEAIACFVAYTTKYKEGIKSMQKGIIEVAQLLKSEWLTKCDQARVPKHLTQNELDDILEAKMNWNRKVFGKSFKPIN